MATSNNNGPKQKPKNTSLATMVIGGLLVFFVVFQFVSMTGADKTQIDKIATSEFIEAVEQGRVSSVTFNAGESTVTGKYYPAMTAGEEISASIAKAVSSINTRLGIEPPTSALDISAVTTEVLPGNNLGNEHKYHTTYIGQDSLVEMIKKHPNIHYEVVLPSGFTDLLISFLPILLIGGLLFFFFFQMQKSSNSQMSFGKAKVKKNIEEHPDVKFDDVAGVDEAVEEMKEVKDFLAYPDKYRKMGAKIPRGCLLVGPPGTGKTLLARAVAGEAKVPFFSISGSDFVEMFVGVGASRVRDLFKQAKESSPSIIFIDEIDAVGRQRGAGLGGGHDEREQTLNQLLVEMDGFESDSSVVLIAATNRPDILDPALLRPGRFDRQITVDAPDVRGRQRILEVHANNKPIGSDVDFEKIARITPGFTGADLANLLNESALLTARRNKKVITQQEVSESIERVIAGPERKGRLMDDATKKIIAYHECGHALVGHTLPHADPVHKITIISRGRALGYTLSIPKEDKVLNSVREMQAELAVFMGGRVAEEIFCDDITTGASNDLERATKIARAMVTQYGMSTALGTQQFGQANHEVFLGRDYGHTADYSDATAARIDAEVARIMKEAHETAHKILRDGSQQMHTMAAVMLERENVEGEACQALLDNKWDEYLVREKDIIAKKAAEEEEARKNDDEIARAAQERMEAAAKQDGAGNKQGPMDMFLQASRNTVKPASPDQLNDAQNAQQSPQSMDEQAPQAGSKEKTDQVTKTHQEGEWQAKEGDDQAKKGADQVKEGDDKDSTPKH